MKPEFYPDSIDPKRFVLLVALPIACLLAAAILFAPPSIVRLALMLVLAVPLIFLSIDRPALVFYLLILILFSNFDIYAPFRLYRFVVILVIASFALALAGGRRVTTHHPLLLAFLAAFVIIAFQSLSVAREFDVGARKLRELIKVLAAVAIVTQFVRDRREFRRFLLVIAGGILLSSLFPFIVRPPSQFASMSLLWNKGVVRYEGFVFEPNTFAMFQLFLIPILVLFFGLYRKPALARPFIMLSILATIGVLILSFSRGGFVGLMGLILVLIVVERRNKPLLLFGLALIAAGIVATPAVYWERVSSLFNFAAKSADDFAITTRLETMRTALRLGLAHPFLGVGIDNFLFHAAYHIPFRLAVHNTFLQIFVELGFAAFAIVAGIVAYNMAIIRRMTARRDDPEAAMIGRALLMQQVAVLVDAFFIPVAYDIVFWLMLLLPAIAEFACRSGALAESRASEIQSGRK
jgi:putative inorganic carbon (HCO3(-)) transporter